jgi:hypothetical protein
VRQRGVRAGEREGGSLNERGEGREGGEEA